MVRASHSLKAKQDEHLLRSLESIRLGTLTRGNTFVRYSNNNYTRRPRVNLILTPLDREPMLMFRSKAPSPSLNIPDDFLRRAQSVHGFHRHPNSQSTEPITRDGHWFAGTEGPHQEVARLARYPAVRHRKGRRESHGGMA